MTVFWSFSAIDQEFTKTKPRELNSLLGEQEREYLNSLRIEKRRSEWLAGRLALKRLLQAVHAELAGRELSEIQILKLENGAPCLLIDNDLRLNESISLSHSNRHVFCAYADEKDLLGVDLELVEKRSLDFIQDFFTVDEIHQLNLCPPADHPFLANIIWSAKEAILKALSLGLTVDTRRINIQPGSSIISSPGWNSFGFTTDLIDKDLRLYWRRDDEFVLTICVTGHLPVRFVQL